MLRHSRAFTLIELALVLVIVSLMTGFGLQAFEGTTGTNCFESTKVQLQTIDKALQNFAARERRLPKPARMDVGSTSPQFGYESNPTATAGVLHGALPHAALNLPAQYAADCWGDKITYAVTDAHTSADDTTGFPSGTPGVIELRGGTIASSAPLSTAISYVALSHGQNKMGGTPLGAANTAVGVACNTSQTDGRNCDGDAIFFNAMPNTGDNSNYFDDLLVFSARTQSTEDCAGQTVSWGPGNACSNSVAAITHGSAPQSVTNGTVNWTGNVTVTCNDGTLSKSSETCYPSAPCPADNVAWANGSAPGGSCGGNTGSTITHGAGPVTVTNSNVNFTGSTRVGCNNGSFTYPGPHSCNPTPPCGADTLIWGGGCSASVGTKNSGDPTDTAANTASWYSGSTDYTCTNGAYVLSASSCVATPPAPCNSQVVNWNGVAVGCSGTAPALAHNGTDTISNSVGSRNGTANVSCYNGTTTATGSCFNRCPASSAIWGTSNACSGPYGQLNHGDSGVMVANTAGGYNGTVTLSCNNGSVSQSAPVCNATVVGTCGSSHGGNFTSAPGSNLCNSGSPSAVTGVGPYTWTCDGSGGGGNANCSANRSCPGTSHTWGGNCSGNSATSNHASAPSITNTAGGYTGSVTASCTQGSWSLSSPTCTALPPVVHGACGTANGGSTVAAPASNLCNAGTPSAVTGSGPYNWNCNGSGGGSNASCSSNRSCPANASYTWNTNCRGNLSELSHTGGVTLNNTAGGYTGTVTVSCNQGTPSNSSPTCTANSCSGGSAYGESWNGMDCSANTNTVETCCTAPQQVIYRDHTVANCGGGGPYYWTSTTCDVCKPDGQPTWGHAGNCCNGDSDSNGTCGTQGGSCSPCATYVGSEPDLYGSGTPGVGCWNYTKADCSTEGDLAPCDGTTSSPPPGWSNCNACTGDGSPPGGGGCCNPDTDSNGLCGTQSAPACSPNGSLYQWNGINWDDYGSPGWTTGQVGVGSNQSPTTAGLSNGQNMGMNVTYHSNTLTCGSAGCDNDASDGLTGGQKYCSGTVIAEGGGDIVCMNGSYGVWPGYSYGCNGSLCQSGSASSQNLGDTSGCSYPDCNNGDTVSEFSCNEHMVCTCN